MKLRIDMNLSPRWGELLKRHGWLVEHWSELGPHDADDERILRFAREHQYVILTHDLDFSAMVIGGGSAGPSILQLRGAEVRSGVIDELLLSALAHCRNDLQQGAVVTLHTGTGHIRILPLTGNTID